MANAVNASTTRSSGQIVVAPVTQSKPTMTVSTLATTTTRGTARDAAHPAWPHTQTPLTGPRAETGAATGYDSTRVGVHPGP